jgi:hypothetical protein
MSRAVTAGYITVQKQNLHRAKIKELAGYSTFSDNTDLLRNGAATSFVDLAGTVILLGPGGDLGVDQALSGELDDEIEVLADALGVLNA